MMRWWRSTTTLDYYSECGTKNQPLIWIFLRFFSFSWIRHRVSACFAKQILYNGDKDL